MKLCKEQKQENDSRLNRNTNVQVCQGIEIRVCQGKEIRVCQGIEIRVCQGKIGHSVRSYNEQMNSEPLN